jgi:HPt (histidine-containing phosphotransfer) domain-containing protein
MAGEDGFELLAEVIDSYLEDAPKQLQAMQAAVKMNDATWLARTAHTLKSTSATLGAITLAQMCKELEAIGIDGNTSEAVALKVQQLAEEYEQVKVALQAECAVKSTPPPLTKEVFGAQPVRGGSF